MRPDPFLAGSRLLEVEGKIDEAGEDEVRRQAENFLRAKGTLTWAEWMNMSEETRAMFVSAGQAVDSERIAALAVVFGVAQKRTDEDPSDEEAVTAGLDAAFGG